MELERPDSHKFAPLDHWREQQQLVSQELNELARGHEERSGGMLTTLSIDADAYPAQRVTHLSINGHPKDPDQLIALGQAVNLDHPERFNQMLDAFEEIEYQHQSVTTLGEILSAGQNIIVATNHCQIQDIAEALGACHIALKQTGKENNRDYNFSTNIVLSKMVAHLGFFDTPATEVLQDLCDKQYFSFPKTDSIKGTKIPELLVSGYNSHLRRKLKSSFKDGGNLFGIAPSGTVDKLNSEDDKIHLGQVAEGTIKILTSPNTLLLPIAVYRSADESIFEILGNPRKMRDADDVHAMMSSIADVLTKSSTQKEFVYN